MKGPKDQETVRENRSGPSDKKVIGDCDTVADSTKVLSSPGIEDAGGFPHPRKSHSFQSRKRVSFHLRQER